MSLLRTGRVNGIDFGEEFEPRGEVEQAAGDSVVVAEEKVGGHDDGPDQGAVEGLPS